MTIERNLEIMQGNQVRLQFALSVRGVGAWNVAGASGIVLTLEADDGTVLPPVTASSGDPTADWPAGKVPVLLPSTATQLIRTVKYALTISMGGEVVTPVRGSLFVERTPGFTPTP